MFLEVYNNNDGIFGRKMRNVNRERETGKKQIWRKKEREGKRERERERERGRKREREREREFTWREKESAGTGQKLNKR